VIKGRQYTALIVGCGIAGGGVVYSDESHAGLVARTEGLTLVAAVDKFQSRADQVVEWYGGNAYSDLSTALAEARPSLVIVSTPDHSHFSLVSEVLKSAFKPKVLIVEKPICLDHEELDALETLSLDGHVLLLANHSKRLFTGVSRAKALIDSGSLGAIVELSGRYYGGWLHNGVHLVDLIRYISGESFTATKLTGLVPGRSKEDPSIECDGHLEYSGARVRITAVDEKNYQLFELDITCEAGRIRVHEFGAEIDVFFRRENELGESILYKEDSSDALSESVAAATLTELIYDYLESSDASKIMEVGLHIEEVKETMNSVWLARNLLPDGS
jgi:predicted dehydrogenase